MTDAPLDREPDDPQTEDRPARESRFFAGLDRITSKGHRAELLLVAGAIFVPGGILAIILGWHGAAGTGYVFEQVPFLISGAALGVALVFLGGFCFFAYWLTVLLAETRRQSEHIAEQTATLQSMMDAMGVSGASAPAGLNAVNGGEESSRAPARGRRGGSRGTRRGATPPARPGSPT